MHLISAKNEHKAAVALATNLPIKQQLPMKLAKLASATATGPPPPGGGSAASSPSQPTAGSAGAGSAGVQQMLPLRLSENLEASKRGSPKAPEGYMKLPAESFKPKLSSNSFNPPASSRTGEDFVAGHSRTGSSPASIQMLSPGQRAPPPKVPEKPATLTFQSKYSPQHVNYQQPAHSVQQQHHQLSKVHDPETNQEIVFL